jgi:class 3 adenylate cyclase
MIEGNIGSSVKMDYTVLGNAVDQAVNLGLLARDINKTIAVSESIRIVAAQSWHFEYAGEFAFNEPDAVTQVYSLENA